MARLQKFLWWNLYDDSPQQPLDKNVPLTDIETIFALPSPTTQVLHSRFYFSLKIWIINSFKFTNLQFTIKEDEIKI